MRPCLRQRSLLIGTKDNQRNICPTNRGWLFWKDIVYPNGMVVSNMVKLRFFTTTTQKKEAE